MYIGMLARRLGAPLVFSTHGELSFDAQRAFERSAILRAGLRRTVRQARIVTACSTFTLKNLETFVKPECPSVVIQNGVDPEEFAHKSDVENGFEPYVLAVGRLVPQKGFDVLMDAFAIGDLNGVNLVIAGDGFERASLERRATDLGIVDRVYLLGAVTRDRLVALMHGAVAFALPSRGSVRDRSARSHGRRSTLGGGRRRRSSGTRSRRPECFAGLSREPSSPFNRAVSSPKRRGVAYPIVRRWAQDRPGARVESDR